jgi:Leucine-rich repeat (LRR) protein
VISQLSDLEVLDIGGNDLNSLPDSFSSLQNLTVLFLDNSWSEGCPVGTTLDEFPMIITKLTKLQTLALSGQYLTKIPEELGDLADLKELFLYANLFRKLPDSITNLEKLETLDIGLLCLGSSLKFCDYRFKFPKEMCRMKSLRSLSFEGRKVMEKDESALRKCLNL